MGRELSPVALLERSLNKRFRKELWTPFVACVQRYGLLREGDRVALPLLPTLEGLATVKLMQELHRHSKYPFELVFLGGAEVADSPLGSPADYGVPASAFLPEEDAPMLARLAQEAGCTKLALPRVLNDVTETTLGNLLWRGEVRAFLPMYPAPDGPRLMVICPLYGIPRADLQAWQRYNQLPLPMSETADPVLLRAKELIARLRQTDDLTEMCIFNAVHNAQLDTFPMDVSRETSA